jgi:hypothetical protein
LFPEHLPTAQFLAIHFAFKDPARDFGRGKLMLFVGLIKDLEQDTVRAHTAQIRFIEYLDYVFYMLLVRDAIRHFEKVKKEGSRIRADRKNSYIFIFFDQVPVVSFPIKDNERDFFADELFKDVFS